VRYAKSNKVGPELGRKFNFQVSQEVSWIVDSKGCVREIAMDCDKGSST
jgi:hypothetical protein